MIYYSANDAQHPVAITRGMYDKSIAAKDDACAKAWRSATGVTIAERDADHAHAYAAGWRAFHDEMERQIRNSP